MYKINSITNILVLTVVFHNAMNIGMNTISKHARVLGYTVTIQCHLIVQSNKTPT